MTFSIFKPLTLFFWHSFFVNATFTGVTRGDKGRNSPGAESPWRDQIPAGGAEKSQQCHKYFLQYSTKCWFQVVKLKIIASWKPPDILRIALQIMLTIAVIQYLLQAANDLSVNWNRSFHTSGPHLLTTSQGCLCDIALMRIDRDETAKAHWWNHRRVCFDEGTESVVSF